MSILRMVIMASIARLAASRLGSAMASSSARGVICHEEPHRSRHQPQALSSPAPADDRLPIAIRFRLVLGHHHEADRLVGAKVGAAIEANERPAQEGELDRQLLAFVTARIIGCGGMRRPDMAVGEGAGVEFCRMAGLAMVEPQAGHKFGHHFGSSLEWREPATPKVASCGTTIPAASTSRRLSRAASQSRIGLEATAQCPQYVDTKHKRPS